MKKEDFSYEVKEVIGTLCPDANIHSEWCKSVLKTLMNNEEGIDVRNYNEKSNIMSKGIRLSIPEANELVNILLTNGYGSLEVIAREYEKRKSLYSND